MLHTFFIIISPEQTDKLIHSDDSAELWAFLRLGVFPLLSNHRLRSTHGRSRRGREGRTEERKKGRKEERKEGSKEGRKQGRKDMGRKYSWCVYRPCNNKKELKEN